MRYRILQGILLGLMLVVVGCKMPPKPMHFNNLLAKGNDRLSGAAKRLYKAIEPLSKGQPADVALAQNATSEMQTTLQELTKEFDEIRAPVSSPPGLLMLDKYREFLKEQQKIYDTCITPISAALRDDRAYPTPADKWAYIEPLVKRAGEMEAATKKALEDAQGEYAKHHNLDPKRD